MSKGLGRVGRAIDEVFQEHPERTFTLSDLVKIAFPDGGPSTPARYNAVARAAGSAAAKAGWIKRRVGGNRRDLSTTRFMHPDTATASDRRAREIILSLGACL